MTKKNAGNGKGRRKDLQDCDQGQGPGTGQPMSVVHHEDENKFVVEGTCTPYFGGVATFPVVRGK